MNGFVWNINTHAEFCEIVRQEYHTITHYFERDHNEENSFNKKVMYLTDHEKELTAEAFKKKRTTYTEDEVYYFINNYGCRGNWGVDDPNLDAVRVAVFGCSFTFGVGMPEHQIWAEQLRQKIPANKPVQVLNFGFPGGSISKSLKFFKYITDIYRLDIAIFLLPTHWRDEYAIYFTPDTPVRYANLIPNFNTTYIQEAWQDYYKYSTEGTRLYSTLKELQYVEVIAKSLQIETYYSSWDEQTLDFVRLHMNKKQILPLFKFIENMLGPHLNNKYARDGNHPGLASHDLFTNEVVEHLVSFSKVADINTRVKII